MNEQNPSNKDLEELLDLLNKAKYNEVISKTHILIKEYPNSFALFNFNGIANSGLKKFKISIENFQKALSLFPNFPDIYNNLGKAYFESSQIDQAIINYKKAINLNKNFSLAYNNLALAYLSKNLTFESLSCSKSSLDIDTNNQISLYIFGSALKNIFFEKSNISLYPYISKVLNDCNYIRPKDIVRPIISLLKHDPIIKNLLHNDFKTITQEGILNIIKKISNVRPLLTLMNVCPLIDLELEKFFTELRRAILFSNFELKAQDKTHAFLSALSIQLFINEHLYNETEIETEKINQLSKKISKNISLSKKNSEIDLIKLSYYRPLNLIDGVENIDFSNSLQLLTKRLIFEPNLEFKNLSNFKSINKISNKVSLLVQNQYEENPYPRWIKPGLSIKSYEIKDYFDFFNLKFNSNLYNNKLITDVLVAGCGTGQHALNVASKFYESNVLALDLSRRSIAYASRKAQELNISIDFIQGDLLDLGNINKIFDIIECAGVLHHMEKPEDGLSSLLRKLKIGGMLYIGLYSELARKDIIKCREDFLLNKNSIFNNQVKEIRNKIILESNNYQSIVNSEDFYTFSEFRDLICHVQEHRFRIPQIINLLKIFNLEFCGFENQVLIRNFKNFNKEYDIYNLLHWEEFENKNPLIFNGMYQFWCQKLK